jgi:hypothetical protein
MAALFLVLLATATLGAQAPAAKWWDHINYLASDRMKGRETGSPEHREAAEYIAKHFKDAGLKPGGTDGFFQPVKFRSRKIVEPKSSLDLLRDGKATSVVLGDEATFSMRVEPAPHVEAPMVFIGYGLQVPETKHDDLAGMDLKGKVALLMTGGPSTIPGPLLAHYTNTRWSYLKAAGAIGVGVDSEPEGPGYSVGPFKAVAVLAVDGAGRFVARRHARTAAGGDGERRSGGQVSRRLRAHDGGAVGAVKRRQGAAAFHDTVVDPRDGDDRSGNAVVRQCRRHSPRHRPAAEKRVRRSSPPISTTLASARRAATRSTTVRWTTRRGSRP